MTDLERRLKKAKDATADAGASSEHSETDLERRLRIAHEEKKQYTRSGAYRRNALQNRTESFMDIVTQGETEARAGIDRYKANRDADYYQQMNRAGVTYRDQDMLNRSVTGYKGAHDLWKSAFDREKDAAADRTRREREMTENPAKAPTVSDIVSRYSGKTKTLADLGNNVRGAIDAYKRQSDAAKAAPTPEEARQQAEESVQYWQNVAREAARYGDVYRQATAKKHLAESVENYSRATKGYFDNLKNTDPGTYYALTMTPEEIDHELELLNNGAYLDSKITKSLTNDERIMGEYWHRTPQEQRQYEHNLERARFAGETDDERNAYISSEKEAYRDARNRMLNDASVEGSVGSNQEPYNRREEITQANEARKSVLENARMTQKVIQAERDGITNDPQIIASGKQKFEADQQGIWDRWVPEQGWSTTQAGGVQMDNLSNAAKHGYVLDRMDEMTEEQRTRIYSLYDRDPETALKLAQTYAKALDDKVYQEIFDWVAKDSGWQFGRRAVGNLAGAVMNLASGLDPFGYGGQSAGKVGDALIGGAAQSATRNGWFGIEELGGDRSPISSSVPFVGRGRAGEASQLVSSMEQSTLTTLPAMIAGRYDAAAASWLETAGLLLQSLSAARSDYRESIEAGLDDTTAKIHAVAAGIAEYTFEKVSFDKLLAQNTSRMTFKKVMKDVLVQAGIEGSEELHTTLANTIMDEIISGDGKSKVDRRIAELVQGGMSMKEAKGVAEKEWLTGIVNDFIGGAASGGFMTGAHYAVGATVNTAENKIANNAVNQLVGQYAGAQTENFTDADTIEAAKNYAEARGIDASGLTEAAARARDASVDEALSALRGSTQSESETEKLSKRDSRKAGKAWTEIRTQISQDFDGKSGAQAAQLYDQMAEQYGAGIKTIVDEVVTTQARQSYLEQSQTAQELQQKVKPQVEALPEGGYKQASMRAYDQAEYQLRQQEAAKTADRLAKAGNIDTEVTYTNKDGSETTAQIAELSDDLTSVVLDNGETVPIKDVQMSADTASAIRIFSRIAGKKAASLAFREYRAYLNNGGTEGYRFAEAVATAYGQGLNGVLTPEQALKMAPDFAQEAAQRAFNAGRQKHQANIENEQARRKAAEEKAKAEGAQTVKGELRGEGSIKWEKMNATRRTRAQNQIKYLRSIAEAIGVDIEIFQSEATRRGSRMAYRGEQGAWYVDKATGKPVIRIDVNAGANFLSDLNAALIATTGHELAHHFQHISPAVYDEYRQAVVQAILSTENGYEKLQRLIEHEKRINRKADGTTISTDEAIDEVVADASRDRVGDRNLWKNVADSMSDEARGKVAQWLHDRFSKILKLTKRYAGFEAADLVLQSAQEYQDLIGELWQKLATQAANAVDVRESDYEAGVQAKENPFGENNSTQRNAARSVEETDAEYLEAVERGDLETAQRMVDEAANRAGYDMHLYHGSKGGGGFTKFKNWSYFTESKLYAEKYQDRANKSSLYSVFGKSDRMFDTRKKPDARIFEKFRNEYGMSPLQETGLPDWTDGGDIIDFIEENGYDYDGIALDEGTQYFPGAKSYEDRYQRVISYVIKNSSQIKSADPITYDDQGNVIPLSERFNEANEDIRFSMREPVEQTDRLIAWHNMNEDALRSALELGGLAMPSWAIKTADRAHTSYGNISVIAPRSLVDPKMNRSSMIFGGDAWTPVFPGVDYKISYDAAENLENEIKSLIGENLYQEIGGAALDKDNIGDQLNRTGGDLPAHYKNHEALRLAYLKSIGQDVAIPTKEKALDRDGMISNGAVKWFANHLTYGKKSLGYYREMYSQELMKQDDLLKAISDAILQEYKQNLPEKAYEKLAGKYAPEELSFYTVNGMLDAANEYFKTGIEKTTDKHALGREIDKVIDEAAYEKWISEKLNSTIEKKGIRNEKDMFTPSGNRRSFDALHYAYNLANIVKAMKAQPKQGRTQFLSGPGSVKGAALKSYNTVEQVREDRGRLVNSEEEGQEAYDEYNRNLEDILDRMSKNGDRFDAADALIEVFQHAKTESGIYNYMQRELKDWYNISRELAHDAYELIGQINRLPMEYFEGKTYDAVTFDETAAVVVPDTMDAELKNQLADAGANVLEYKAGDDEDRLEKVNSVDGAKFSARDYGQVSDLDVVESLDEKKATTPEAKALIREAKEKAEKIRKLEQKLSELRGELKTTDRALNTRGITKLSSDMLKRMSMSNDYYENLSGWLSGKITEVYQNALDQMDRTGSVRAAGDALYNGAQEIADFLMQNAGYHENIGGKWQRARWASQFAQNEEQRQAVMNDVFASLIRDWSENRNRAPMHETEADRIAQRATRPVQKKLDETRAKLETASAENAELAEKNASLTRDYESSRDYAGYLRDYAKSLRNQLNDAEKAVKLAGKTTQKQEQKIADLKRKLHDALQAKKAMENAKQRAERAGERTASRLQRQLEAQIEREQRIMEGKLKPLAIQRMLAEARDTATEKARAQAQERFANQKENRKRGELRARIINLADEIQRTATRPTESKYVPASLYGAMSETLGMVSDLLESDNTKGAAKRLNIGQKILELKNEYEKIKSLDDAAIKSEYDEDISMHLGEIETVLRRVGLDPGKSYHGMTLRDLPTQTLQDLYDEISAIYKSMRDARKALAGGRAVDISTIQNSIIEQQAGIDSLNEIGKIGKLARNSMLDGLSTMRAVEMMSGWNRDAALYKSVSRIEDGAAEAARWSMNYNKRMQPLKTGKNELTYRNALTKRLDWQNAKDMNSGKPVKMTKLQALQIYMSWLREESDPRVQHLHEGGTATIRDARDVLAGKASRAASNDIRVTPELMQEIKQSLTEWDQQYMDAIHEYMTEEGEATNKIHYQVKHKVLKTSENYFPEMVNKDYVDAKLEETAADNLWVMAPGATNELRPGAKQPVIIDGTETVMAAHVRDMANYIGLALPIRDFAKVLNGKVATGEAYATTIRSSISPNFGQKGIDVLKHAAMDVQGGRKVERKTQIERYLNGLHGAFVRSTLLINPSVTIKQAASYAATESILSYRAVVAGNRPIFSGSDSSHSTSLIAQIFMAPDSKTAQRIYDEIDEHTALHYQRRQGMSYEELAHEALRQSGWKTTKANLGARMEQNAVGRIVRKTGARLSPVQWIQRMDVATTAAIWVACKTQSKIDGFEAGTQEFWNHTTQLYERCLRETQPMYDPLHRSERQKGGGLMQYLFPFRTVPFQNHGQIVASFEAMKAAKGTSRAKEATRFFRKTVVAQVKSAIVFSALSMLAAGLRHKPDEYMDENGEVDIGAMLGKLGIDTASTLFSVIFPLTGSETWEFGESQVNKFLGKDGKQWDIFSVGAVEMLNDMFTAAGNVVGDAAKAMQGKKVTKDSFKNHVTKLLLETSAVLGIPLENIKKYSEGIVKDVGEILDGKIPAFNNDAIDRGTSTNIDRYLKAWSAGDEKKRKAVLEELRGNLSASGKDEKQVNQAIRTAMNKEVKTKVVGGSWTPEKAAEFLRGTGAYSDDQINSTLVDWIKTRFEQGKLTEAEAIEAIMPYTPKKNDAERWDTVRGWAARLEHEDDEEYAWKKYEELTAAVEGREEIGGILDEYRAHGYTDKQLNDAVKGGILAALTGGSITENEAIDLLTRYVTYTKDGQAVAFDKDKAWKTVQEWQAKAENDGDPDYSYNQYDELFSAIDANKDVNGIVSELTAHGYDKDDVTKAVKGHLIDNYVAGKASETALKNQLSRYCGIVKTDEVSEIVNSANCKKTTGYYPDSLKDGYVDGKLSKDNVISALKVYKGLDSTSASNRVRAWDFQKEHPDLKWDSDRVDAYYDKRPEGGGKSAYEAGISVETYDDYRNRAAKAKGVDANGDGKTDSGSKKAEILRIIDSLDLSRSQKDALYYINGWAASTIYEAPWN